MSRKICVLTGTRAEYGLLRWIMEDIQASTDLDLQVLVTCMHLSPEFGLTYTDIEADGFTIHHKVEMLLSADTPTGITKSMGLGMIGFGDALEVLAPDLLLVLGDRFETMACVAAAMVARVPVAHLQGGELSEGAIDDAILHHCHSAGFELRPVWTPLHWLKPYWTCPKANLPVSESLYRALINLPSSAHLA